MMVEYSRYEHMRYNMKKITMFLLVFALLASILTVSVTAEQTNMEVNVPRIAGKPFFDGHVTEKEWGERTLRMVTDGAATTEYTEIGYNEEYGLKNTFYYSVLEGLCDTLAYDMWIRWDDEYLYVAAVVDDPDPFSLPKGGEEIWNGDCIQIRVDETGPNAVMLAYEPDYNYKTDAFNGNRFKKPWSNDREVFNGIMGLVKGNTQTFWRCGKTYGDGWNLANDGGLVGINLVRHDDDTCTITYEGAIPWSSVNAILVPKAGDVYGMGVAVYCSDSNELNGMLQWGSGVGFTEEQPRATRGGSQAIVLTDETAGEGGIPAFTTYGDATGDSKINLADASVILKHIAKWNVPLNTDAADVTADGKVNLTDVSRILKFIAKWDVILGPEDESWKAAYSEFLYDNQERLGHACYYEKGNGRFALAYITDDNIPELYIVDDSGQTMIYTYKDGSVKMLNFCYPSMDVRRFGNYEHVGYVEKSNKVIQYGLNKNLNGELLSESLREYVEIDGEFILKYIFVKKGDGTYYYDEYDIDRVKENDFDYFREYVSNEVTKEQYDAEIKAHGFADSGYRNVTESDLYGIVPTVIDEVFA